MDLDDEELEATRKLYGLEKADLEKAIEILKNYVVNTNKTNNTDMEWHGYYNNELHELKEAIETVLKALEKLQEENNLLKLNENNIKQRKMCPLYKIDIDSKNVVCGYYEGNADFIPKKKIEDKIIKFNDAKNIEELKNIRENNDYTIPELVQYVLQELLEEK